MRYIISLLLTSVSALPLSALPSLAEVPKVVTDIAPIHALTAQVMGDLGSPELLLAQGANAHDVQLRPSQAALLAEADLIIWLGPEMTPWLDRALAGLAAKTHQVALLGLEGTHRQDFGATAAHDDHATHDHAEHGHDEHDHADDHGGHDHGNDHGHDHSGLDPHAWLDPANAQYWLGAIAVELGALDPENAAQYAQNAKAARADLAKLDDALKAQLAAVKDQPFVTFHDAYGYFTAHYGLNSAGSIALGDAAAPGAAHLRALKSQLTGQQNLCLFPEAQHDPRQIEVMAADAGAKIGAPLDPEGSLIPPGPGAYEQILRSMADALSDCLAK